MLKLRVNTTAIMLRQRRVTKAKMRGFVVPSGYQYEMFMLHNVCEKIVISQAKNYQNRTKHF